MKALEDEMRAAAEAEARIKQLAGASTRPPLSSNRAIFVTYTHTPPNVHTCQARLVLVEWGLNFRGLEWCNA